MADIKDYEIEKKKLNKKNKSDYKEKIRSYRKMIWNRILLTASILAIIIGIVSYQYYNHQYTEYEVISTTTREVTDPSKNIAFYDGVLGYSNDGAYYRNGKGNLIWNISFQMQNPLVQIGDSVVGIADYDGQSIYILNNTEELGEIHTNMPIKSICISENGVVAAVLEDKEISWIYLYDLSGNVLAQSRTTMPDYGYPLALDISPDGTMLMVSFLYVDQGEIKTTIAFFNFDEVGQSQLDNLVSGYNYTDAIIPIVNFMDGSTSYAVGDERIIFYSGKNKPEFVIDNFFTGNVQGVYSSNEYVGLVFLNDQGTEQYKLVVYDNSGNKISEQAFELEYTDLFFDKNNFIIYNEKNCLIYTVDGRLKFEGEFNQAVQLMYPSNKTYEYNIVTADTYDVIALN